MRKLGGSLRKDSAEAIHETIHLSKNLEIHFVERQTSKFTGSAEDLRKLCGRCAEGVFSLKANGVFMC